MSSEPLQAVPHSCARAPEHPVDKAVIVALVDNVLGWDLASRDRQGPPTDVVETAISQLSKHVVGLCKDLRAHIHALPGGDDIRRRAAITLGEADRRLYTINGSVPTALSAQNLARLVGSLNTVSDNAEKRVRELGAANAARVMPRGAERWRP